MAIATAAAKTALKDLHAYAKTHEMTTDDYVDQEMAIMETWVLSLRINSGIAVQVNTGTGTGATTAVGVPS